MPVGRRKTEGTSVKRGEIWLVNLDSTVGSEIQKTRPCVVISPAEMHDHLKTLIVAPMTTKARAAPYRVALTFKSKKGLILLDQIRTIDKARLVSKLGKVAEKTHTDMLETLQEIFAQ